MVDVMTVPRCVVSGLDHPSPADIATAYTGHGDDPRVSEPAGRWDERVAVQLAVVTDASEVADVSDVTHWNNVGIRATAEIPTST